MWGEGNGRKKESNLDYSWIGSKSKEGLDGTVKKNSTHLVVACLLLAMKSAPAHAIGQGQEDLEGSLFNSF